MRCVWCDKPEPQGFSAILSFSFSGLAAIGTGSYRDLRVYLLYLQSCLVVFFNDGLSQERATRFIEEMKKNHVSSSCNLVSSSCNDVSTVAHTS